MLAVCFPGDTLAAFLPANDRAIKSHTDSRADLQDGLSPYSADTRISVVDNAGKSTFNNLERTTRTVRISGFQVVFDSSGNDADRLYDRMNDRSDIKYVYIYADTVVIEGPLKLPGTDVWIYARELYFRDTPEGRGSIDTAPRSDWLEPAAGENGKDGERAGNIMLALAHEPDVPQAELADGHAGSTASPRLIAHGGDGQAAGSGRKGKDGASLPDETAELKRKMKEEGLTVAPGSTPTGVVFYEELNSDKAKAELANARWPDNGSDALPPGKPGKGGSGGNILTSFVLPPGFADVSGGRSGKTGDMEAGGGAGKPNPAAWVVYSVKGSHAEIRTVSTHTSRPGGDAKPADVKPTRGDNGTEAVNVAPDAWLTSELIGPVLSFVENTYLNEDYNQAAKVVDEYLKVFASIKTGDDLLDRFRGRLRDIRERLANDRDYFGNPKDWVPRLSLAACESALEKEVDDSIYTIYKARSLDEQKADYEASINAAKQSIKANIDDLKKARSEYGKYRREAGELEAQSGKVSGQLDELRGELQARVDELTKQAKRDAGKKRSVALWRQALQVLAVIANASPFYSPITGTIGGSLTAFSKLGPDGYGNAASSLTDTLQNLNQDTFNQAALQFGTELNGLDLADSADLRNKAVNLMRMAKSFNDKYDQVRKAFITSADSSKGANSRLKEIQDKLSEIEGKDTTFKDLNSKILAAKSEQDSVVKKMAEASFGLGRTTKRIADDLSAIDLLNQKLTTGMDKFDTASWEYVEGMARKQQQRLYRYQYYLSRAYYFEKLKPCPAKLVVNRMLRQIENEVNNANGPALSEIDIDTLKRLFDEELKSVLGGDIDRLQTEGANSSQVFFYSLSDSELAALNANGEVEIDLTKEPHPGTAPGPMSSGTFATAVRPSSTAALTGDDNRRIVDLGIAGPEDVSVEPADGQSSPDAEVVRFFFEHSARSEFRVKGRVLSFTHNRTGTERALEWGVTYDLSQRKLYPLEISENDASLLNNLGSSASDFKRMLVRPSLAGPIRISRTVSAGSEPVKIDKLRLYVRVTGTTSSQSDSESTS